MINIKPVKNIVLSNQSVLYKNCIHWLEKSMRSIASQTALTRAKKSSSNKEGNFLKKLWCSVGGEYHKVVNVNWPP